MKYFTKRQVLRWKFQLVSFWKKCFTTVHIWNREFTTTTRLILIQNLCTVSDLKKIMPSTTTFCFVLLCINEKVLQILCFSKRGNLKLKIRFCFFISKKCQVLNWKVYNMSDFELKILQGIRFWLRSSATIRVSRKCFLQQISFWLLSLRKWQILKFWYGFKKTDFGF